MSEVLSSWKDVAAYLGKSVRTVQRWEAELGLPIHRPDRRQQRIVLAYPEELRRWVGAKFGGNHGAEATETMSQAKLAKNTARLAVQVEKLKTLSTVLQQRTAVTMDRAQRTRTLARRGTTPRAMQLASARTGT